MSTLPGPPRTPVVGSLLDFRRDRLGFFTDLARTYGDAARFWVGPQEVVSFAHPDHVHDLLVAGGDRVEKGPVLRRAKVLLGDGLLTSEGELHRRQRQLVQPALTQRRVNGHADVMVDAATAVGEAWRAGAPLDAHAAMLQVTVDVAARALLAADVDEQGVGAAVEDVLAAYDTVFLPFPGLVQRLPLRPIRRLRRGIRWLDGLVSGAVASRRRDPASRGDVLGLLLGSQMSDRLVRDEVITLLLAGHETTASALTWSLHLLAGDPAAQSRLGDEVDRVVGRRRPTVADVRSLRWTRGVLSEALRLYPPSWAMGRLAVADVPVGGVVVPAGVTAIVPQWVIHRDARWWPQPERFDPARWLTADESRPRYAFFPFGAGQRRCIGEAFAWTEGILALAVLAQRWWFDADPAHRPHPQPVLTLRPRDVWLVPRVR